MKTQEAVYCTLSDRIFFFFPVEVTSSLSPFLVIENGQKNNHQNTDAQRIECGILLLWKRSRT